MIATPLTPILRVTNSLENQLTSVNVVEKDKIVGKNATENILNKTIENLLQFQSPKLSKIVKDQRFRVI